MNAMMELKTVATAGVLNDNTSEVSLPSQPKTLVDLERQRKNWETTAYRKSNQQLYAVLADCLAYGAALPDLATAKRRTKELSDFLAERGYVVKNDSPLMTRVVKAVFGNVDRRRISTYSLVLRSAQKEGVEPVGLASWIEARGGIQEVRLARSATYKSPKQKAEAGKSRFSSMPTLAVAKEKLAQLADAEHMGCECVLLAEQQSDGSFHIKALARGNTAVNAAFASLYERTAA